MSVADEVVVVTLALPEGQDWAWYATENVVGLSSRLDDAGRARALDDLQAFWRRQCIRAVPDARPAQETAHALA